MGPGCGGRCLEAQVCGREAGSARLAPEWCCLPGLHPQGLSSRGLCPPGSARVPGATARVPVAGSGRQRPSSRGQQWAPDQAARDKEPSERRAAGACVLGRGWEQPGRKQEGAVASRTSGSLGRGWWRGGALAGPVLSDPASQGRERTGRRVCRGLAAAAGRVGGARVGPGDRGRKDSSWGHLQRTWGLVPECGSA